MRVEKSIEVDRPLHEVFNYLSDVTNYPKWMAHVLEVRTDSTRPPRQHGRFSIVLKSVGRRFEIPYERASYETDRRYMDRAVGGPIPEHQWQTAFEEVPAGTRLTRAVDVQSGGLLKLLEPLQKRTAARQLAKDLQTLKDVLEAR